MEAKKQYVDYYDEKGSKEGEEERVTYETGTGEKGGLSSLRARVRK